MKKLIPFLAALSFALFFNLPAQAALVGFQIPSGVGSAPILLGIDLASGSPTNGENSKGAYLKAFGLNFGTAANLGTAAGLRFYVCGVEVDNYRALDTSRISTANAFTTTQRASVQIGSLGGATGSCDVKVKVNGVDSNTLTGAFYIQPGHFWFADNTSGVEATGRVDNIALPFRYVQNYTSSGTVEAGIWAAKTPAGDNGIAAGDTIVIRATGSNWVDNVGCSSNSPAAQRWAQMCNGKTGTAPNGSAGNGYYTFVNYPGPKKCDAGACSSGDSTGNAAEQPHYKDPVNGNGGIFGSQSGNGYPNTPTWGAYVQISGIWFELVASSGNNSGSAGDAAPINGGYGDRFWRIVDNELGPWPSTVTGTNHARAGGFTGQGDSALIGFNYIHDIASSDSAKENHCLYFDDNSSSNTSTINTTVSYNWIVNCTGGSAIQFYMGAAGNDSTGNSVHHNYIDTWNKYGINMNTGVKSINAYNNILTNGAAGVLNCIWLDNIATPATINITHNNCYMASSTQDMIGSNAINSGTVKIQHNSLVMANGRSDHSFNYLGTTGSAVTWSQNLYFDPDGVKNSAPGADTTGVYGNPQFINYTGNFRTAANGSGVNACTLAEALAVADDLFSYVRPVTGTGSPGAGPYNDIGAYEYH